MVTGDRQIHKSVQEKLQIDKILAVIGGVVFTFAGIYLLVYVNQPLYGISSLLASVACLAYLIMKKYLDKDNQAHGRALYYDAAWLLVYLSAIAIYIFRTEQYERPLAFFIMVALASGVLVGKVIFCQLNKRQVLLCIVEAVAIGLALEWSIMLMYPTVIGLDTWTHQQQTMRIVNGEWIGWGNFPVMYYLVAGVIKVTGLSYKFAVMSVSFIQVGGDAILVYLLGKKLMNYRTGIIAALVVSFSSWHIFFGTWTIPNVVAMTLLVLIVYLIVRYKDDKKKWLLPIILIASVLLIFTHILSSAWLLVVVGIVLVAMMIKSRYISKALIASFILICSCTLIVWWYSGFWDKLLMMVRYNFNPEIIGLTTIPGASDLITTSNVAVSNIPIPALGIVEPISSQYYTETFATTSYETLFNASGMIFGFAIAICGCLYMLSKENRSYHTYYIIGIFAFFIAGGIIPSLFGMSLIEHRWWYAAQIFGAILVATLIASMRPLMGKIAVVIVIIALCFLMVIGLPSNMDNNTFSKNQLVRYALTEGEITAIQTILVNYDDKVGVDAYYTFAGQLFPESRSRFTNITTNILSGDYDNLNCNIILVRDDIVNNPIAFGEGHIYKLNYDPNEKIVQDGYSMIYDLGGVKGYKRQ